MRIIASIPVSPQACVIIASMRVSSQACVYHRKHAYVEVLPDDALRDSLIFSRFCSLCLARCPRLCGLGLNLVRDAFNHGVLVALREVMVTTTH